MASLSVRPLGRPEVEIELCKSQGDRHREAALHTNVAEVLDAAGRREEAMAELQQPWPSS